MKIAVCTATHGRPKLTRAVLEYYVRLVYGLREVGIDLVLSCCHTTRDHPGVEGWIYTDAPNKRLGAKFNRAIEAASVYNPDGYCMIGSDDLLNPTFFIHADEALRYQADYLLMGGLYLYDLPSARLMYLPGSFMGAGRVVSAHVMQHLNCCPYPETSTLGIDARLDESVIPFAEPHVLRCADVREHGVYIVDIKTAEPPGNIHSFGKWQQQYDAETTDGTAFMQAHFPLFELPA